MKWVIKFLWEVRRNLWRMLLYMAKTLSFPLILMLYKCKDYASDFLATFKY